MRNARSHPFGLLRTSSQAANPDVEQLKFFSTEASWKLRKEGVARTPKTAGTKGELLKITDTFMESKTASVNIHEKDGIIQEERTSSVQLTHARRKVKRGRSASGVPRLPGELNRPTHSTKLSICDRSA